VADIFREVDEDVRKDELQRLWRRWGKYAIGAAIVVALAAAAFAGWRDWQASRRAAAGAAFLDAMALLDAGEVDQAAAMFLAQSEAAPGGYPDLARLSAGQALASAGQRDAALAALDALAADGGADGFLRDLARLAGARLLVDDGDPAEVRARLAPLLEGDSLLAGSARELEGLLALRAGDNAGARAIFEALAGDAGVPAGLRARAAELAVALGGAP
jgi:hypothetical protein